MQNVNKLLSNLSKSGITSGLLGGVAGGALSGALMSKKGRKTAGKIAKVGGIAAVGALAWKAYSNYKSQQPSIDPAQADNQWQSLQESNFAAIENNQSENQIALHVMRCMIAAAMADGHIDGQEYSSILSRLDELQLSQLERDQIFQEIARPMTLVQVINSTQNPEVAVEVYTASLMVMDLSQPKAQDYLQQLSNGLQLPAPLIQAIHAQLPQTQARHALPA